MSPSITPSHPYTSRGYRILGLSAAAVFLLFLTSCPASVLSQTWVHVQPSPTYFADQQIFSLLPPLTSSGSPTATFPLTFNYSTALPLLLTNATGVTVTVPSAAGGDSQMAVMQLATINAAGFRAYVLTSSGLGDACRRVDTAQQGQCSAIITLTSPQWHQIVQLSIYTLNQFSYTNIYSDVIPPHTWKYYVRYVQSSDLPVSFALQSPSAAAQLTTLMYVSAAQQLFTPGCPLYVTNGSGSGSVSVNTAAGQGCILSSTTTDVPDYYIVGLYGFGSPPSTSLLQVTSAVTAADDGNNFSGYAILSLLSLVLATGFIGLVLVRGCCVYRRWNIGRSGGSGGNVSYAVDPTRAVYDPAVFHFQTTAGQAGVLRTDRAGVVGATEAEIASLPVKVYEHSGTDEGDDDHPRCTICLDEYEPGISRVTALGCCHEFHTACIGAWLRQRRHCPLCLQLIDQAQDVKQRRSSIVATPLPEVELANIRPTISTIPALRSASANHHSHELASRTVLDERDDGGSVIAHMGRYSSAAEADDADMCVVEIGTPQHIGRPPL